MNCRHLEARLESYLAGGMSSEEGREIDLHLLDCDSCADLVELARLADAGTDSAADELLPDLVVGVVRETTGDGCRACQIDLCALVDGTLDNLESELVRGHLTGCSDCSSLAAAVASLAVDLPTLAEIRPDRRFVASVLAATLPWRVRLRRWWQSSWPRCVQRPRFAMEAAYVSTLILVLIFAVPGTPLQAMPSRAVELARSTPMPGLGSSWRSLEEAVVPRVTALTHSEGVRAVVGSFRRTVEFGAEAVQQSLELAAAAENRIRTLWDHLASMLERAGETPSPADQDSNEEKS